MADEKVKKADSATETKQYYEPLPEQVIIAESKKYGYNFSKITFAQGVLAQERAQLRNDRMEFLNGNSQILVKDGDPDYLIDMAGILFVPLEGKKFQQFDRELRNDTGIAIGNSSVKNIAIIENVIKDFFWLIGKRSVGYESLMEDKRIAGSIRQIRTLATSLTSSSSENSSLIQTNSTEEQKTDLQVGE